MRIITLIILCFINSNFAYADKKPFALDLSSNIVKIDSDFNGTEIVLSGNNATRGDVIVVVRGPKKDFVVRKKAEILSIWINKLQVKFFGVSSFYHIYASKPLNEFNNIDFFTDLEISDKDIYFRSVKKDNDIKDIKQFKDALLESRQFTGLYGNIANKINLGANDSFSVNLHFPVNIESGKYIADCYFIKDGKLIKTLQTSIEVIRTGILAFIYDIARNNSVIYGLMAILIPFIAGLSAGFVFKKL